MPHDGKGQDVNLFLEFKSNENALPTTATTTTGDEVHSNVYPDSLRNRKRMEKGTTNWDRGHSERMRIMREYTLL